MENADNNLNNAPTMPPDFSSRNKSYAAVIVPLALFLIIISGAKILGIMFGPRQFDEIGPGLRIFQQSIGFAVAILGIVTAVGAWTSTGNVSKFFNAGDQAAAEKASVKAKTSGKQTLLFIGFICVFLILFIVNTFFLGK